MKRVVIGTAGHVDHGKTSLIKALTGTDCDRLKEEKQRGLTIELGFAALDLPGGERVGVVDVPGHVRFIHHMLSGASGLDLVLLVVAADEGVMPQTVEHVRICELLGIRQGVVALTKTDLVDADLLELARSDVREYLDQTFLKDAPIIPVSAGNGSGLTDLLAAVDAAVGQCAQRFSGGLAILPIDRVFSVKGFGTVVTGTLNSGQLKVGQDMVVLPAGRPGRIRNIQVHDSDVADAAAGMRTAVNLQGLAVEDIARGQWLVPPGTLQPTRVFDARMDLLAEPDRKNIRVHIGTAEVPGSLNLYEIDDVRVARIRLRSAVVAVRGTRFIVRCGGRTVGGGEVLNPCPVRRFSEDIIRRLLADEPEDHLRGLVTDAGLGGLARAALLIMLGKKNSLYEPALNRLLTRGEIIRFDSRSDLYVDAALVEKLKKLVADKVRDFHGRHPAETGMGREELRSGIRGDLDARLFHRIISELLKTGILAEEGPSLRLEGFSASLARGEDYLGEKAYELLQAAGLEPPKMQVLAHELEVDRKALEQILGFMVRSGRVVRIDNDIYLTDRNLTGLKERIRNFIAENGQMSPTEMKDVSGVSRKYAIPYMEYLDRIRFTERLGNVRKLGSRS